MSALLSSQRERTRLFRFAIVGAIGAVVDFAVMNFLTSVLHWPLVAAGALSFVVAVLNNFTWNRYWTYPDSRSKPLVRQLAQFGVVNSIGLGLRIPTLHILEPVFERLYAVVPVLHTPFFTKNSTLAVAILVVMTWNFFVNRYWTYSDVS